MNDDDIKEKDEARSIGPQSAESGREAGEALCPLHLAMERIAQAAVSQTLYYAQGEYAPRPEILRELEGPSASAGRHAHLSRIADAEGDGSSGDNGLRAHSGGSLHPPERSHSALRLLRPKRFLPTRRRVRVTTLSLDLSLPTKCEMRAALR
jgi:hypothetical protein